MLGALGLALPALAQDKAAPAPRPRPRRAAAAPLLPRRGARRGSRGARGRSACRNGGARAHAEQGRHRVDARRDGCW